MIPTKMAAKSVADIPRDKLPKHVAIIMDGNGRWAQSQGLPRIEGHRRGADAVRRVLEACPDLGIETLTLYCFSSENWKRPQPELDFLMSLLEQYLINERPTLAANGIRLKVIGKRDGLPERVLREIDISLSESQHNNRLTLCLAINYGSRTEIVDAARNLCSLVQSGRLPLEQIDEPMFASQLYTQGLSDPDLLIRTSGEMRISNFLLWQISYAEIFIAEAAWPEFGRPELEEAIVAFASRDRRYGGLSS